ncbi:MAG TPA: MBOAT family O-acyltransferase [Pirellulales bacterium]|nr:MBOAT family O-acyltransferase [Pirellulales bacterium]
MDRSTLDLYKPEFWYTLAIAVLVLVPLTAPVLRKWAWAAINLAFLRLLLGGADAVSAYAFLPTWLNKLLTFLRGSDEFVCACAGILAAYIVLNALRRRVLGIIPLVLGGLAVLAMFLVHKLTVPTTVDRLETMTSALRIGGGRDVVAIETLKSLLLAIGFSYVALRLVDALRLTYEGRHAAPDLPSTINFLLPFHMLAAGPIQGYADFLAQPAVPAPLSASDSLRAVERIALGLFKKFVLADVLDKALLTLFRAPLPYMLVESLLSYVWVYLDFSGYSDICVGAGRLMGVATPENFNRPYVARNLVDFWDRWHMSLSQFIYRNLFIPLQMAMVRRAGPRAALWCGTVAFSVSFLLCGLWHGQEGRWMPWTLWGAMNALGLVAVVWYRAGLKKWLSREALNRYNSNLGVRLLATILTQGYVAATLVVATWPWE